MGDEDDYDMVRVRHSDLTRSYLFEGLDRMPSGGRLASAVHFAKQRFLDEVAQKEYNLLLAESWKVTLLRKGDVYRIEVQYTARPAHVVGIVPPPRPPPFLGVLQAQGHHLFS